MNQHLKQAIAAARAGKKPQAKVLLARVIKDEPENVNAWFLLSSLADTEEQKIQHLQKVLELQPGHPAAAEQMAELVPPLPEPVEETFPDSIADTLVYTPEVESEPAADMVSLPEAELPSGEAPDDPDEAMAWLEQLAANQGASLDELPSLFGQTAEAEIEAPVIDYTEPETEPVNEAPDDPDEAMAWLERLAADQGASLDELPSLSEQTAEPDLEPLAIDNYTMPEAMAGSDVPDDPDEAMAWLEQLATDQDTSMDELPTMFDRETSDETATEDEDDYSWLDEESFDEDDFLGAMPTLVDEQPKESQEDEEPAKTLSISNDFDFVSQSKGDSIPAWLAGEEGFIAADTVITGAPEPEVVEQPEPDNLPDWLNDESLEDWLGEEGEKSGQVVWKAGEGDDSLRPAAPGAKKEKETKTKTAARKTAAASDKTNLYLGGLVLVVIILIIAILYLLVVQPF
jgi:hypothetical protein